MRNSIRFSLVGVLLLIGSVAVADVGRPQEGRIQKLIERLGSDTYSHRQQAERELQLLGFNALDQLLRAQYDDNLEISLASKKLVSQLPINWSLPGDASIVATVMRDYRSQPLSARIERARWLAMLEDGVGADAAARIVRYDPSELVAKHTVFAMMEYFDPDDSMQRLALRKASRETLGASRRTPAVWLRSFVEDSEGPTFDSVRRWQQFTKDEVSAVERSKSTSEISDSLRQWYVLQALKLGDDAMSRQSVAGLVNARKDDSQALLLTCNWLIEQEQSSLALEFVLGDQKLIEADKNLHPQFLYCLADIQKQGGDLVEAEATAKRAFEISTAEDDVEFGMVSVFRYQSARFLESRGLKDWALREYQRLIDDKSNHWRISWIREKAVWLAAEMLHDQHRDKEAADTLKKLVDDLDDVVQFRDEDENPFSNLLSRMYFFRSEHFRQQADREQQIEFLMKAVAADPTDADVLIAMHRLPRADTEWKVDTKRRIEKAVRGFESKLQRLRGGGVIANREDIATELNQVAWLVGNTEGDQQKAVEYSRRSLELRPQSPGSLDTLGRAYFAVGDLENALKYQRRAVKLEPHTRQISRQLEEFEAIAAERKTKSQK